MTRATVLLTALLASLSLGAAAQTTTDGTTGTMGAGGQTQTFTELDTNNDGMLDEDEIRSGGVSGNFDDIDANGDDEVDRNEYYQHQRQQQ